MASPKIKQVILDFEAKGKFGQDPETPKPYVLMANENGIVGTQNTKTDNVIGGDIDSGGELYISSTDVQGSIRTPLYYEQLGVLLRAAMGDAQVEDLTAGGKAGYYKHTFKSNECIPSVVVEDFLSVKCNKTAQDKDIFKRFNGLRAGTLSFSASPEGDYNIEVGFTGATARDNLTDPTLQGLNLDNKIVLEATRIKNAHAKIYFNDEPTPATNIKEISLSFDRGVEAMKVLSAGAVVEDSKFDLTGSVSAIFDGEMYKKAMTQEKQKVKIVFESGDYKAEFIMAEVQFAFEDEARSYGNQYPLNMKFNAVKTGTTDAKLKVELTNKVAKY